jgi:hypothetical protein
MSRTSPPSSMEAIPQAARRHYFGQTLLAKSLDPRCYENHPTFLRVREEYALPFRPIPPPFTIDSFTQRQAAFQRLCEVIWDPRALGLSLPDQPVSEAVREKQRYYGISLRQLVDVGLLHAGQDLHGTRNGETVRATLTSAAAIKLPNGTSSAVLDLKTGGWGEDSNLESGRERCGTESGRPSAASSLIG